MSSRIARLEEQVDILKKDIKRIKDQLAMLPPSIDPLKEWEKTFDELDKGILTLLLKDESVSLSSVEIGQALKITRVKAWRHLKKIHRTSKRIKGKPIVVFNPSLKTWNMNWDDFEFPRVGESS